VRRIGALDRDEGFAPELYPATTQILLHAVRGVYRGDWTSSLSSAWVEYLLWLREHLTAGARDEVDVGARAGRQAADDRPDAVPVDEGSAHEEAETADGDEADEGDPDDPDDPDDEEQVGPGYGELMVSMTRSGRRHKRHRER
jgi:hypothetical protein